MIRLPKIGFGCYGIGGYNIPDQESDGFYLGVLETAILAGINFFDTAENYALGRSERLLGEAVKDIRKDVIIATKISPENLLSADLINMSIDRSLHNLKTDYIDLYQIHWPHPKSNIAEVSTALLRARDEGKIKNVGVCNHQPMQIVEFKRYLGDAFISVQNEYNFVDNDFNYKYAQTHVEYFIAYSPFKYFKYFNRKTLHYITTIMHDYDITLHQVVLSWYLHKGIIPIFTSMDANHIAGNVSMFQPDFPIIPKSLFDILDTVSSIIPYEIDTEFILADTTKIPSFSPSPSDLRDDIIDRGIDLKPIKIKRKAAGMYELIEGLVRYLAYKESNIAVPSIIVGE